jgi:hypothetical protein
MELRAQRERRNLLWLAIGPTTLGFGYALLRLFPKSDLTVFGGGAIVVGFIWSVLILWRNPWPSTVDVSALHVGGGALHEGERKVLGLRLVRNVLREHAEGAGHRVRLATWWGTERVYRFFSEDDAIAFTEQLASDETSRPARIPYAGPGIRAVLVRTRAVYWMVTSDEPRPREPGPPHRHRLAPARPRVAHGNPGGGARGCHGATAWIRREYA